MYLLPAMLNVRGKRCLVVGAGTVALRRARALIKAGAVVTVVAPEVDPTFEALPVTVQRRPYRRADLNGTWLVVVASSEAAVNRSVAADGRAAKVLVNRPDDPGAGDFTVPAHAHHGPVTLAVHTGGASAAASAAICRQLSGALDPDWPRLLEVVKPFRRQIQDRCDDPRARRALLKQLTAPESMAILKQQGNRAVHEHCQQIVAAGPSQ